MMFLAGFVTGIVGFVAFVHAWMRYDIWKARKDSEKWEKQRSIEEAKMPTADMKLSEAITKGISMRPKRAQGVYFAGDDRSDVLGAAYQGLTGEDDVHNYQVDGKLEASFPILRRNVSNPETGEVASLKKVLRQLNDKHQWKRKNIARFVKSLEDRTILHSVTAR